MNKTYRSIWNEATGAWVAVQENVSARGKRSSRGTAVALNAAALLGVGSFAVSGAHAATVGDNAGNAVISSSYSGCAGAPSATFVPDPSTATGGTFSLGCVASARGANALAFGSGTTASGSGATAFGEYSRALNGGTVVMGPQNYASGAYSSVLGQWSTATGDNSIVVGGYSSAKASGAIAVGTGTTANATNSLALGNQAAAGTTNSVALGNGAVTAGANATGSGTINGQTYKYAGATPAGVVSIGSAGAERQITNVAAGQVSASSTNAVNGSQLYATNQAIANIAGQNANAVTYDSSSKTQITLAGAGGTKITNLAPGAVTASSTDAVNGSQLYSIENGGTKYFHANSTLADSSATGANSTAIGPEAVASGTNAIGMGPTAAASGDYSAAIGNAASTTGPGDTALGASAAAAGGGTFATAVGSWAQATGPGATAIGGHSNASAANATAVGYNAQASTPNSVALGNNAVTGSAVPVAGDTIRGNSYTFAGAAPVGVVSVGAPGSERQITNVAAGQLNAASTDAVNGSQLYATNQAIESISGLTANAVTYDDASKAKITLAGAGGTTLTNLAPGAVDASSSDAVTGAQLFGVSDSVTNINNDLTKIHNTLTTAGWGAQATSSDPTGYTYGGFQMDASGNVSNPAVLYVPNTIGTANAQIVLDPGQGNSAYFVNGDRAQGFLPKGTVISNVADGIQDTDAANVGQVANMIAEQTGGGNLQAMAPRPLQATRLLGASSGSGVDLSTADGLPYKTAAYYSQVRGTGNASGSTSPTDVARATAAGSIAIGSNTEADGGGSTAVGIQSLATANDSVALGSGSVANLTNTVSVGSDGTATRAVVNPDGSTSYVTSQANARRVVNMAAGQSDTDAVNVSQLKGVTSALGGGATVNADGSVAAPTYALSGGTYTDVGSALTAVDQGVTNLAGEVANAVMYDTSAHDKVTLGGTNASKTVTLTNVADAKLNASSTDAVNGAQLFATNQNVSNLAGDVTNIQGDITNINGKIADAVVYDSSAHDSLTLGGKDASAPVALHNVANALTAPMRANCHELEHFGPRGRRHQHPG
ncbi:ESPR-type extended signal peptide-containing protein [Paraburkholderia sp. A1RO-5L]|uniref:ESPR-type extended signal peptide-containing protein n=1 Tax=Paraburkholderia sp. A1RO-5L TaxID=3028370 RepID=UPI003B77DE8D